MFIKEDASKRLSRDRRGGVVSHEGHSIRCRVNDRGPFVRGRVIDVSISAARALGMIGPGIINVSLE